MLLIFFISVENYTQVCRDRTTTITLSAVGDLMCHTNQFHFAQTGPDSYDFNPVYSIVKYYLSSSDFTFGNLETVTAGSDRKYSGYPLFNTPDEYISALKKVGFDLLSTANNHALDRGEYGVLRTIKILNENEINYNGTFTSRRDRDSIRVFNIKGIRIAFLAYSYGTNGNIVPKDKPYLINKIDFNLLQNDIRKARMQKVDVVLVHFHFGTEYQREPDKYQRTVVDSTIKYGADVIIGGHPHVIEPLKMYKTKNGFLDSGLVAYSLGNFFSNQRWRYSDCGVILNISITKNLRTGVVYISKIDYVPTWLFKGKIGHKNEFVIFPSQYYMLNDIYTNLRKVDFQKMFEAFQDTRDILQKYSLKLPYISKFSNNKSH